MKVLHVSSALSWRGGEQQIAYLMEEIENAGIVQYLYCPLNSELAKNAKQKALSFHTFKKRGSVSFTAASRLAKFSKAKAINIVHVHDSHAHTLAVLAVSFFRLKASIVLSRRVDFAVKNNMFSRWKYNHHAIKKILCVSNNIASIIAPDIKQKEKIQVVYSGIKSSRFKYFDRGKLRNEYGFAKDEKIIANIAAVADHKDYFTFVDVAEILIQDQFKAKFFIIGSDGGQAEAIKNYIASKNLDEDIIMTGYRNDIPQIMPELDLLLFTSKQEGLGTSILDAFACKIPVVASRAGGIPELVIHEKTGLSAPIKDKVNLAANVKRILNDHQLKTELTKNAFNLLDTFSTKATASQTIQVYKDILLE